MDLISRTMMMGAGGAGEAPAYWIATLGDAAQNQGRAVAVDGAGNAYIVGDTNVGNLVVLVAKYASSGSLLWQRSLGEASGDIGYGIALDLVGNVYLAGRLIPTGSVQPDVLVAKYDTNGTIQWQRSLGGADLDEARGIASDSSGNVYVVGYTLSQGEGSADMLVVKYDTNGTIQWQRTLGGTGSDQGLGIAVTSSGDVYVTGLTTSQSAGSSDMLLVKYNTSGAIQWQRRLGGVSFDRGTGIAVDSSGNAYITGLRNSEDFGTDVLIAKYNTSGTIQWQRVLGGAGSDQGNAIAVDSLGDVYITGVTTSAGAGGNDALLTKYNTSGTIQWQRVLGGAGSESGSGIALGGAGSVYLTGTTSSQGAGGVDILIAKLPDDGSLTGSYGNFTYAAATLTAATATLTSATTTLTAAASTLADAATTLTDAATTLTSVTTTI